MVGSTALVHTEGTYSIGICPGKLHRTRRRAQSLPVVHAFFLFWSSSY